MLGPPKLRCLDRPLGRSLEELVPRDHFYRFLDATLDLTFVRDWVQDSIGADLIVTSGSPVGAGAPGKVMEESLAGDLEKIDGVQRALPIRSTKVTFKDHQILLLTLAAGETAAQHKSSRADSAVFRQLGEQPDTVAVSEKTGEQVA